MGYKKTANSHWNTTLLSLRWRKAKTNSSPEKQQCWIIFLCRCLTLQICVQYFATSFTSSLSHHVLHQLSSAFKLLNTMYLFQFCTMPGSFSTLGLLWIVSLKKKAVYEKADQYKYWISRKSGDIIWAIRTLKNKPQATELSDRATIQLLVHYQQLLSLTPHRLLSSNGLQKNHSWVSEMALEMSHFSVVTGRSSQWANLDFCPAINRYHQTILSVLATKKSCTVYEKYQNCQTCKCSLILPHRPNVALLILNHLRYSNYLHFFSFQQ